MTDLARIQADQTRNGDWLRENADWRESDEVVDTPRGRMRKRTAYAGYLLASEDAVKEEMLYLRESTGGRP